MEPEPTQPTESMTFLAAQLANATSKSPGIPRTKTTLDVVSAVREVGYDELLAQAEIELISCHLQGCNLGKVLRAFSSTLTQLLYHPGLYDSRSLSQLGRFFPEMIKSAAYHPDVPLSLINRLLVGLKAFQESLDPSPTASDYLRRNAHLALGQAPTEHSFLDRTIDRITPADSRSLQHTIDITQIEMAVAAYPDSALQVAQRILAHELPGGRKAQLLRVILPALVAQRVWRVAWGAHLISYEYDREVSRLADLAEHLRFLTISGMWRRPVKVLERHLALIRHTHDPWDLCLGPHGTVGSLESLVLNGYGGYQLKVSLVSVAQFHELPILVRPTVREVHDALGGALNGLMRHFDGRNDTVGISVSSELLGYIPLPDGLVLAGDESGARFMARLLRAWTLLECDQRFDTLLLLGGLEQTNLPSVVRLVSETRVLTSLTRIQMSRDATDRLENQPVPHESGTGNQRRIGDD